tara:strand:+ start:6567 stop:6803 length:237 start_codon:yes stop_codon:yes gene_type:complete
MSVVQKIIGGNSQPAGGRAVVGVNGARGLDSSSVLDANHTLEPTPVPSSKIDESIARINSVLISRYDDPRYYTGDAAT